MAAAESILRRCHSPSPLLPCRQEFSVLPAEKSFPAGREFELVGGLKFHLSCSRDLASRSRTRQRLSSSSNSRPVAGAVCSTHSTSSEERPGDSREGGAEVGSHGGVLLGRRSAIVMASLALPFLQFRDSDHHVEAMAGGLDKYVKKKKLDPLETYVPTVLLAQSQFQEVDGKLGGEEKTYADARSLLRTGPAATLRADIRAVAQYAAETGSKDGASAVEECLSALEDLDFLLLQASRSQGAPVDRMRRDLTATVAALDRLLATVPTPILEKARAIAEAYKESAF